MARRTITAKQAQASRRNIRRAQASRVGRKEPRSVGRITAKRQRFSKPAISRTRKARTRRTV